MGVLLFAILGLGAGGAYALLSLGVVSVYRGSGTVSFAQGALAMAASYVAYTEFNQNLGLPIGVAAVLGVLVSAALGAGLYLGIMRPARKSSPVVRLLATLGAMLLLEALATLRYGGGTVLVISPLPHSTIHLTSALYISLDRLIIIGVVLVITVALWLVYRFTLFGQATSAVAENDVAAAALGWSSHTIALINWTLGGALAGLAGILIVPFAGLNVQTLTLTIITAIAAALIGGFRSFPLTVIAALVIGIIQSEAARYVTTVGVGDALPLVLIVLTLIVTGRSIPVRGFLSDRLPAVGTGRVRPSVSLVSCAAVLAIIWTVSSVSWLTAITITLTSALLLLSIVVLTGYAGQVSLAQYAIAGVGAFTAGRLAAAASFPFILALLCAIAASVPVGLIFALPAARTRGVSLAVVTLALGSAITAVVFGNYGWTGGLGGTTIGSVDLFGLNISPEQYPARYATLSFVALALGCLLVARIRRGPTGLRMLVVRDNEQGAASLGIGVFNSKLIAFAISAGLASVAGVLIAFQQTSIVFSDFDVITSILLVAYAAIGGIGFIVGALVGSVFASGSVGAQFLNVIGLNGSNYLSLIAAVVLILNLLAYPDGIASFTFVPERFRKVIAPRAVPRRNAAPLTHSGVAASADHARDKPILDVEDLHLAYGGVVAIAGASLSVMAGEVVGLIGPNGAGKTSIMDAISGFARPQKGRIALNGREAAKKPPHIRARWGLGRVFQSAELTEVLTVEENLRASQWGSGTWGSGVQSLIRLASRSRQHGQLKPVVTACLQEFGLMDVLSRSPESLTLGQRRICAVARALAAEPDVLMLDEPAAGLDDGQVDEFRRFLRNLAEQWGIGVLLIEHHVGLVMSVCDRVYVLQSGQIISSGTPDEVSRDSQVVSAYLGSELRTEELEASLVDAYIEDGETKAAPS